MPAHGFDRLNISNVLLGTQAGRAAVAANVGLFHQGDQAAKLDGQTSGREPGRSANGDSHTVRFLSLPSFS